MSLGRSRRKRSKRRGRDPLSYPIELPPGWERNTEGDYPSAKLKTLSFVDFGAISDLAAVAPIRAAEECQSACTTLQTGYQKHLRRCLAATYAIAYHLVLHHFELERFVKLDFWKNRKQRPSSKHGRRHTLRFVLCYVLFGSPTTENTVSRYYVGMEAMFNKGVKPDAAREIIMKKGPEKMYEEAAAQRKKEREKDRDYLADLQSKNLDSTLSLGELSRTKNPKLLRRVCAPDDLLGLVREILKVAVTIYALHAELTEIDMQNTTE